MAQRVSRLPKASEEKGKLPIRPTPGKIPVRPISTKPAFTKTVIRDTLITDLPEQFEGGEWYAIPTNGDGSCLIHSVLQASSAEYRALKKSEQVNIADLIRIGMAFTINNQLKVSTPFSQQFEMSGINDREVLNQAGLAFEIDKATKEALPPYSERVPRWFNDEGGMFLNMMDQNINAIQSALNARINDYMSDLEAEDPRNVIFGTNDGKLHRPTGAPNELLIDYSLYGLTHLMNSRSYIGDELINLIADYFQVNIVMVYCASLPLRILHQTIRWETRERDFVFVAYVPGHYQTIGRKVSEDEMQYCFPFDHEIVAPFIPSNYDFGHGEQWKSGMEKPTFVSTVLDDSIENLQMSIINSLPEQRLLYVTPDDEAYDELMAIEDFEFINYVPHFGIFLQLRSTLATALPCYYNLLRHLFMITSAFDLNDKHQMEGEEAEITNYLWPSITDAPVQRINPRVRTIPEYQSTGQFPGENILSAIMYVYNLDQKFLLEGIDENGSIGRMILNTYNQMMTESGEEGEEGEVEE